MAIDITVYKGSSNGNIVKGKSHHELGRNEAVVEITHSGVCGTDEHAVHSDIVLGHEGVGIVRQIGPDVKSVKVGDRVGYGWVHYFCGRCEPCRTGLDSYCENGHAFMFTDHDQGSFASHVVWDADALVLIPDEISSEHAGPLMCGGVTVWGALSVYNVRPSDRVGVVGIGGLGHLAIQFAAKMGCEVVAFSSTESKKEEAFRFGAKEFYATKGLKDLSHVGKLNHLLITTNQQPDFNLYIPIMKPNGTIYPLTVSFDDTPIPLLKLIAGGLRVQGSAGAPRSEFPKMLKFSVLHNIRPVTMTWPMNEKGIEDAMATLREGRMRYRGVLVAQ